MKVLVSFLMAVLAAIKNVVNTITAKRTIAQEIRMQPCEHNFIGIAKYVRKCTYCGLLISPNDSDGPISDPFGDWDDGQELLCATPCSEELPAYCKDCAVPCLPEFVDDDVVVCNRGFAFAQPVFVERNKLFEKKCVTCLYGFNATCMYSGEECTYSERMKMHFMLTEEMTRGLRSRVDAYMNARDYARRGIDEWIELAEVGLKALGAKFVYVKRQHISDDDTTCVMCGAACEEQEYPFYSKWGCLEREEKRGWLSCCSAQCQHELQDVLTAKELIDGGCAGMHQYVASMTSYGTRRCWFCGDTIEVFED